MGGARLIYGSVWAKPTLWSWFICYFTSVNVVTRMVFFFDKRMAGGKNVVRVPEDALFLLAAGGGLPSTLLAMQVLRHKRAGRIQAEALYMVWRCLRNNRWPVLVLAGELRHLLCRGRKSPPMPMTSISLIGVRGS